MGRKRVEDRNDIRVKVSVSIPKWLHDILKVTGNVSEAICNALMKNYTK